MKNGRWLLAAFVGVTLTGMMGSAGAQEAAAPAAPAVAPAAAPAGEAGKLELDEKAKEAEGQSASASNPMSFLVVVTSSGWLGIIIWIGLGGTSLAMVALAIDAFVTIKEPKIAPPDLVDQVREAMEQGDVMKAIKHCEDRPTPLANVLSAGFSNVQQGFDVIQDVVGVAADLETEKLMQRVAYLNTCANLAPMLGLLGTVQGMIWAFTTLATTTAGAAQQKMLAIAIAQALWTTAAGLCVAIPAVTFYTFFKNRAMKIILGMEGLTMDLIKSLRNVEVV